MERVSVTLPAVSLKVIVGIHFVLTTWATLSVGLPTSYVFSNFALVVIGCWAISDKSTTDSTVMFLLGMIFTIISDIVALAVFYNTNLDNSTYRFSMGMAILNLILKPLYSICIFMEFRNKGGEVDTRWAENPYVTIEGQNSDNRGAPPPSQP